MKSSVILSLLAILSFYYPKAYGQTSFFDARVNEYGQLEQVLGDKWNEIDSLIVYGPINEADFKTMWKCSFEGKLTVLNLEYAQVKNNKIPDYALYNKKIQTADSQLKYLPIHRLILPESIQEIGNFAFSRMLLEQVNIPKSLKVLGHSCFSNCHYLSTDPLIIPEGVTSIPAQCFLNCQCFKKVVLPSTLITIERQSFYNTRVEEVNFPEGLEEIQMAAFLGSDLIEAILPNTLKAVSISIFSMCPGLKRIKIPEGIEMIPAFFASMCPLLETINIPKGVTTIGEGAFSGDVMLSPIELPEGVICIEKDAFENNAVDSIVFPASLEYLGAGSCGNWSNLKKIYSLSPNPPSCAEDKEGGHETFHGFTPSNIPVYVPVGSGEKYRQAFGWNYFSNIIETDKLPTGIVSPQTGNAGQYNVYGKDGKLVIDILNTLPYPLRYSIYSISGELIEQGQLTESLHLQMKSDGVYLVRIGATTHKVFL